VAGIADLWNVYSSAFPDGVVKTDLVKVDLCHRIESTTAARQLIFQQDRRFLRLATPRQKRGESYLLINQLIIVVSFIKKFIRLTALALGGAGSTELELWRELISTNSSLPAKTGEYGFLKSR